MKASASPSALCPCDQTLGDPVGQARAIDERGFDHDADGFEGAEPRRILGLAFESRQRDERDRVGGIARDFCMRLQRDRAFLAGLAARDADFDQFAIAEQRQSLYAFGKTAPVKIAIDFEHVALRIPRRTCGCANLVRRLDRKQMLVAVHHVQRRELPGEMCVERVELEIHRDGWDQATITTVRRHRA